MKVMKKNILNIIAVNTLLFALSGSLNAQSTIEGFVKEGSAGTPLPGINITIPGYGATTSSTGFYRFSNVTTGGTITVATSVAGYSGSQRTIVVAPGINQVDFWFNALSDADVNSYGAIEIGSQRWMSENLKTTKYNGGSDIPNVTTDAEWVVLTTPAYCWYNNDDASYKAVYGALYNWYAVNTGNLCPTDWHVPSQAEWETLYYYLGSDGGKIKEAGTAHFVSPNTGATNESGFTALPGGVRAFGSPTDGSPDWAAFTQIGYFAEWYCSDDFNNIYGLLIHVGYNGTNVTTFDPEDYRFGVSVRCVSNLLKATLTSTAVSSIGRTSAESGGNITNEGTALVTARGVCWSTLHNPTISYSHTNDDSGAGTFPSSITGLTPNTTYYIRAYATNSVGTNYGNELSFTTLPDPPIATSVEATGVASTNAILYGKVNANGASTNVTFEYGTTNAYGTTIIASPSPVTRTVNDTVRANISGLSENTTYHFRVKAVNAGGTTNGSDLKFTTSSKVTDIDGNSYNTVKIGRQLWFQENLKSVHYRNGDEIPNITNLPTWSNLTTGGYCNYGNDSNNGILYGRLYNAYTVLDNRNLCPDGWHVPTEYEWIVLENYLIANGYNYDGSSSGNNIGKAMASETGWQPSVNQGAVGYDGYPVYRNKSGFTGLPAGFIYPAKTTYPGFNDLGSGAVWWTSTEVDPTHTTAASIWSDWVNETRTLYGTGDLKSSGFSVRCTKGEPLVVTNINDNGTGSLRAALSSANSNPDPDIIKFNIPGMGPFTIKPASPLPTIDGPVVIDGYSQPGASLATSTQLIQLDGTSTGAGQNGLTIDTSNCSVRGLVINKFTRNGIQIESGNGNWIKANSIYDNDGQGIVLSDSANNNQSFPVLDTIVISLGDIYIDGRLNSLPDKYFTLDFFASKLRDTSGFAQGQTYLGSTTVETDNNGLAAFKDVILPYKTIYGDVISATATDPDRNTSQFSKALGGLPEQDLSNLAFNYYVNPDGVPNVVDPDAIVNAVEASFNTWNGITTANLAFNYVDKTTERYAHIDGENIVSFSDDQYEFGDWVLAITAKTLQLGATDAETKIVDADIIFNPFFANHQEWNFGIADDMPNVGFFDIQSITTHEIGHILGLLHTGVHNATMWFEMPQGIDARSLEQDDKSWASYKYPSGSATNFGSISGNITYGYDGKPVAGALVLAINAATKDTVHSYSDVLGNYLVPGLGAGSYNVYIEPLDGSVRNRPLYPRNISLYIYCNTVYTDYPGEFYSGNNELAVETTDIVTPVTVNAGSATPGINFITNKDITPPLVVAVTPPDLKMSPDIIIKFSEPVDINTFSGATCYLIKSGDTKSIGGTYRVLGSQTNIVLFTPGDELNYNTNYTLHITKGVTDLAKTPNNLSAEYQFSFKTGLGDKVPPKIVDIIPDNQATEVFVDQKIMVFFSEPMNKSSVESSLSLTPSAVHTFTWDSESSILTFIPTNRYEEGLTYTVSISTGAKDLSGNAITSSASFSFKTVAQANPTISYLGPGNNAQGVAVTTPVVVDFSEPIDTLTVTSSSFKLLKGSASGIPVQGRFEFLNGHSRVVFRPYTDLDFGQSYLIVLTADIKDVSPNVGTLEALTSTFITANKPSAPVIDFIDPPSDHVGAEILIGGKGFDPDPSKNIVMFYGGKDLPTVQAVVTSASLTSLKVQVPVGAKSGPISVNVNGATTDILSPFDFYVVQEYSDPCNELTGSAQTGGGSRGVTLDISGATAYVTNSGSNTVSVIDVATLTTKATINVEEYPLMIDMNPGGTRVYVTNFRSHSVSVIDPASNTVIKSINVGYNPYGIKVSPDGKQVYVAHYNSEYENVSVIDADPSSGGFDHVVANVNTGTRNRDLDVDANGTIMVVTGDDGLKIIERAKTALGFDYSTYSATSGIKTRDAEIVTEAGIAVVSTMDGALLFIDINKGSDTFGAVIANSTSGGKAGDVKPDFSGVFLYVTNPYDNQVTVYKITYGGGGGTGIGSYQGFKMTEYWKIPVGISPQGLVINTYNDQLFVANEYGTTGSTGSLTQIKICCAGKSPNEDIVAVTLYIRGMMSRHTITKSLGNMLTGKLNDALINVAKGKTKTAINSLNAFISKVKELRSSHQILYDEGQRLIDDANAIIAKLNGTKSGETESDISDAGLSNRVQKSESIPESRLGLIYPNPFSQTITVNYEIAENKEALTKVQLMVYDVNGRLVSTLVDQMMQSGCYTTSWNGDNDSGGAAPYGTYFVLFRAGTVKEVNKIMLIKPR
jgi:uncharacterized protein (TIGR02145 family)